VKSHATRALALRSRSYDAMLNRIVGLIDEARRTSARAVNAIMTGTYWSIGRYIVEFEQGGKSRAEYGEELLKRLAADLKNRCGRGFAVEYTRHCRVSLVIGIRAQGNTRHCRVNCQSFRSTILPLVFLCRGLLTSASSP
jgi:hypothetical protein